MNKIFNLILILILISACSTTPQVNKESEVKVTGTKISKDQLENKEPVMVVMPGENGGVTLQDLLNTLSSKPFPEGANCNEALLAMKEKGYKILTIEKNSIHSELPSSSTRIKYNFKSGDCVN